MGLLKDQRQAGAEKLVSLQQERRRANLLGGAPASAPPEPEPSPAPVQVEEDPPQGGLISRTFSRKKKKKVNRSSGD